MLLEPNRVAVHDDCLIIDSDFGILPIKGPPLVALASRVLPLLDGRNLQQLLASFAANEVPDVERLLEFLERSGVLRAGNGTGGALRSLFTVAGGTEAQARLRDAVLGVVCGSDWGGHLISELAAAGVRIRIVNSEDECDLLDLLVVLADSADVETHRRCARWARQRNIAVLHGTLSPTEITIGPLFRPRQSACWNCGQFRAIANQPHALAAHRLDEKGAAPGGRAARHPGLPGKIAANLLALEALKAVLLEPNRLLSRLWIFSPLSLASSSHLIVPLPSCDICGGAGAIDRPSPFSVDLDALRGSTPLDGALPGWIDPRTGIISAAWFENDDDNSDSGPYFVRAQLSSYANSHLRPAPADPCGGKGINRSDAMRSGIGEALERYSAGRIDNDRIHCVPAASLSGDVLSPTAIGLYAPAQYDAAGFPFRPFDEQRDYHWIEGSWLAGGNPVWLPAELAFFSSTSLGDELCQVTTSGLALGRNSAIAGTRALLELVERDATMMTWLCRLPANSIILDQNDDTLDAIRRRLKPLDVDLEFYLLEVGIGIPTVLACGFGDGQRWPGLCVGSAAHPSARAALAAAALEMVSTAQAMGRMNTRPVESPEAIRSDRFGDHALYYVSPERANAAAFLRGGSTIKYSFLPEISQSDGAQLAGLLADIGVRVATVDVTSADVAMGGLRVVRAMADGLLPIHCGQGFARCGSRRLRDRLAATNLDPHPFC